MISTRDLKKKAGIKSIRTLTRWHQLGIIPQPVIRVHPGGRGKMAYWPDWVVDKCRQLKKLQDKGHSLTTATLLAGMENAEEFLKGYSATPPPSEHLKNKKVKQADGKETNLHQVYMNVIASYIKQVIPYRDGLDAIITRMEQTKALDVIEAHLKLGYNPVMLYGPTGLHVLADVYLGHYVKNQGEHAAPYVMVPMLPPIRKVFRLFKKECPYEILVAPVAVERRKTGSDYMDFDFIEVRPDQYQIIPGSGRAVDVEQ